VKTQDIPGRDHRRGELNKATVCGRCYELGAFGLGTNWLVKVKDVKTGKVLDDLSADLTDNLATQSALVERLAAEHEAGA
jgi:hypothetical protein